MTNPALLLIATAAATAVQEGRMAEVTRLLEAAGDDMTSARTPFELGMHLLDADMPFPATALLALAVERAPRSAHTWLALGHAFRARNAPKRAIECYRRTMELSGETAEALYNMGECLLTLDEVENGRQMLVRADELAPSGMAQKTLANLARHQFRYSEAAAHFKRALELLPEEIPDAKYCHTMLGITALLIGDFSTGWREYEWRLSTGQAEAHERWNARLPHWDGALRAGLRLIVHYEQGLGDTLHFVRYCRWLRDRGVIVTLVVQRSLTSLLERQSPPLADRVIADGAAIPAADAHVSLISLPAKLYPNWTGMEFLPTPYLTADPARVEAAGALLRAQAGGRPAIGLVWAGNPDYPSDHERSLRYEELRPLLTQSQIAFFSLQLGSERTKLKADSAPAMADLGDHLTDFNETAAMIAALDGIVTVDSAPAHLAGALGRPTAVLIPRRNDFRWGLGPGASTPWYPSVTLCRQRDEGNWAAELKTLAARLASGAAFRISDATFDTTCAPE